MYQHLTVFTPTMDSMHPTHIQGFPPAAGLHVPAWMPPCPTCMAMCPLALITSMPTCTFSHGFHLDPPTWIPLTLIASVPTCISPHRYVLSPHMDSHPFMIVTPSHLTLTDTCPLAQTHGCPLAQTHGCPLAQTHGCPLARTHGCPLAQTHGCPPPHHHTFCPHILHGCPSSHLHRHMPTCTDTCPLVRTHAHL